jgi:hypothetical protein
MFPREFIQSKHSSILIFRIGISSNGLPLQRNIKLSRPFIQCKSPGGYTTVAHIHKRIAGGSSPSPLPPKGIVQSKIKVEGKEEGKKLPNPKSVATPE